MESGVVSLKNEVNILLKSGSNLALGGITYWIFGYALSFGTSEWSNPFIHIGTPSQWFLNAYPDDTEYMGHVYARYVYPKPVNVHYRKLN